jgi:hypothetical protein
MSNYVCVPVCGVPVLWCAICVMCWAPRSSIVGSALTYSATFARREWIHLADDVRGRGRDPQGIFPFSTRHSFHSPLFSLSPPCRVGEPRGGSFLAGSGFPLVVVHPCRSNHTRTSR